MDRFRMKFTAAVVMLLATVISAHAETAEELAARLSAEALGQIENAVGPENLSAEARAMITRRIQAGVERIKKDGLSENEVEQAENALAALVDLAVGPVDETQQAAADNVMSGDVEAAAAAPAEAPAPATNPSSRAMLGRQDQFFASRDIPQTMARADRPGNEQAPNGAPSRDDALTDKKKDAILDRLLRFIGGCPPPHLYPYCLD